MKFSPTGGKIMKNNIIGLFVCILLISSVVIPVAAITERNDITVTSYDSDVPIWDVGDEWTYHFIEKRSQLVNYVLSGDLTLKVVEDTGDSYILKASTRPYGGFDMDGFGLKTTFLTSLSMRLQIRKTDFALENYLYKLKGFLFLTVGSFTLPIPIQVIGNIDVEFDPPWVILPFPLYDEKAGLLSGTEILHINLHFGLFWGLISVYGPQNYTIPLDPVPYMCSEEQLTVEAGTFDVYNVTAVADDGSRFVSYYSEKVGSVAKEIVLIPFGGGRVQYSLTLELKDYKYSP